MPRVGALTPGDVFGHEAFISQSTLRGATVLASTECTCLAGDRQLLLEIVASVPQSVRRGIRQLVRRELEYRTLF